MIELTKHQRNVLAHALMTENRLDTPEDVVASSIDRIGEEKTRERIEKKIAVYEQNYLDCVAADGAIALTEEEHAVMDHVLTVETPEHWVARNVADVGVEETRRRVDAKVSRHKQGYLDALAKDGAGYKNAKQCHIEQMQLAAASAREEAERLAADRAKESAAIESRVLEKLRAELGVDAPKPR